MSRRCTAALVAAAGALLLAVPATATATATSDPGSTGLIVVGTIGPPGEHATTRVPECAPLLLRGLEPATAPPGHDHHPQAVDPHRAEQRIREFLRCLKRFGRSLDGVSTAFVYSLQRGNEVRACKLLTSRARERLGTEACPAALDGLGDRLRPEREPSVRGFDLETSPLRGEFDLRLVRPYERIGFRFEEEDGYWRISNIRDLLRQQLPPEPRAHRNG